VAPNVPFVHVALTGPPVQPEGHATLLDCPLATLGRMTPSHDVLAEAAWQSRKQLPMVDLNVI